MHPPILGVGGGAHLRFCDMEIQHQDDKRESKRHSLPNVYADTLFGVVNKTQRSNPGQARNRRQYEKYGKVGQQRQEGFVSDAQNGTSPWMVARCMMRCAGR